MKTFVLLDLGAASNEFLLSFNYTEMHISVVTVAEPSKAKHFSFLSQQFADGFCNALEFLDIGSYVAIELP